MYNEQSTRYKVGIRRQMVRMKLLGTLYLVLCTILLLGTLYFVQSCYLILAT